ncbi:MAG TPA: hypothetical protein PLK94_07955, partial [Alphaproteobacteria bacterium]|nr:hypothetical protein [Alphaproteobacteria bacterium]
MTTKNTTNATNPEHMKRAIIEAFLYRLLSVDSALDFNTEDRTVLAQNEFESLYHQDLRILLSDYAEHFDLARTLRADQIDHRAFSKLPADLTRLLETQTPPSSKTRFLTRDFEDCRALYIDETTPLCEKVESDILPPESF